MFRKKSNIILFFIFTFLLGSILLVCVYIKLNLSKIDYIKISNINQIKNIWENYHNHKFSNDVQVSRSLSPYNNFIDSINEGNQVVTDGVNIYSISKDKIIITNAKKLLKEKELNYQIENFKPLLLYVTKDKLVVIGELTNKTVMYIYDKETLEEYKNFTFDAIYITSRLIDNNLYLINSKIFEEKNDIKQVPKYYENGVEKRVHFDDVLYVENTYANNFVNIIKIDINNYNDFKMKSYLGLGQVIYFSNKYIYIAEEKYVKEQSSSNKTIIIKFNNDDLELTGIKEVNGYVLDKESLNEYNGNLRIATISYNNNHQQTNNIYILNKKLQIVGKLENFSQGQVIQAVIFIEDKAYIETFNFLDTFYVIDLRNEKKPKIISELKFAGYNTRFIPYDKNNIIAFGLILNDNKQAVGLKVSLLDVSNPKNVKLKAKETFMYDIYNNVYSEVLYDSRTLLLDKKNNILGFPIIYWTNDENKLATYKQFFIIYKINDSLTEIGEITHYEGDIKNDSSSDIKRGLIINQELFTVSDRLIKKNNLEDLKLIKESYLSPI